MPSTALFLHFVAIVGLTRALACDALSPPDKNIPDSYEQHLGGYPGNCKSKSAGFVTENLHELPFFEPEVLKQATPSKPTALSQKWLQRLGNRCMILVGMRDGVMVVAAQDPSLVGKKYHMQDVFSSCPNESGFYCRPLYGFGKSFFIGLREMNYQSIEEMNPQQEKEILRLAGEYLLNRHRP
jgi:hypothetical protein